MRAGRTTRNGGVHIKMSHLGPERVRKEFKGMVERCADCGFDLAGGLVEVVPTAHYFMGGVVCRVDTSTELPGLFVAGEDAGGAHGANRLGGNGVANSTVFGGIAGETMAAWLARNPGGPGGRRGCVWAPRWPARSVPFARKAGDLNGLRERLLDAMWDDVGVMRDAAGLKRGLDKLAAIEDELLSIGVADGDRAFNLTWHDWLNLRSLVEISKVIALAALRRENSRGAHYPRGLPGRRRPRHLDVHRRAPARRDARHRRRAGAVHHRQARAEPAQGGGGVRACPSSERVDPRYDAEMDREAGGEDRRGERHLHGRTGWWRRRCSPCSSLTILSPRLRIWPTPGTGTWQSYVFWPLFRGLNVLCFAMALADRSGFLGLPVWLRALGASRWQPRSRSSPIRSACWAGTTATVRRTGW